MTPEEKAARRRDKIREWQIRSAIKAASNHKPRKALKTVSVKRKVENTEYSKLRRSFLSFCPPCPVTGQPATQIHHMNGRSNWRLNDTTEWLGVSLEGHAWIHANGNVAREKGWLK